MFAVFILCSAAEEFREVTNGEKPERHYDGETTVDHQNFKEITQNIIRQIATIIH